MNLEGENTTVDGVSRQPVLPSYWEYFCAFYSKMKK